MKVGTITYNIGAEMNLDELISLCEETGLEGLELRTTHAHGVEPDLDQAARRVVRDRFDLTDVALHGLGSTCEYHSPDPEELQRQIELTYEFVDLARDVGADGVKVRPNALPEDVPVAQTLRQIGESLRQVGDYAAKQDVKIWLEVHGRGTSDPKHVKTIMDVADHPQVYACWNCNQTDIVDGSIRENFQLLRDKIDLVHAHDLFDGHYGGYPFGELVSLLHEMDFQGFVMAEIPGNPEPERLVRYFVALWHEMVK